MEGGSCDDVSGSGVPVTQKRISLQTDASGQVERMERSMIPDNTEHGMWNRTHTPTHTAHLDMHSHPISLEWLQVILLELEVEVLFGVRDGVSWRSVLVLSQGIVLHRSEARRRGAAGPIRAKGVPSLSS